jgi:glutathione S-transferase
MLKLYIANKNYSSWSLRPWVLMKQLGIPFEECLVPFGRQAGSTAFESFSPTGRVPCLVDGQLTVWDSLAITEYLAEAWPEVWPEDKAPRAWARCASAEMHSGFHRIRDTCTMNCGLRVRLLGQPAALLAEWKRIDALWNEGLRRFRGPFLAGARLCAVDAFFAPFALRVQTYSPQLSEPALSYVKKLLDLPHMQDWYASALAETWRDEAHETEARQAGEWLQDYRARAAI